jgi:hypothetical protein
MGRFVVLSGTPGQCLAILCSQAQAMPALRGVRSLAIIGACLLVPLGGLKVIVQVKAGDPPVSLVSIAHPEDVNALTSDRPLTSEMAGLTVIYGDNASGKSGYARLLKRVALARHQEEVLSDVFRDTAIAKPMAALTVRVGDKETSLIWPESTPPELQRMLFYDDACGEAHIATESDFPYRPSALFVMDGLIEACVAVRSRVDAKLEENSRSAKALPVVDEDVKETEVGKYLMQISGSSSRDFLDVCLAKTRSGLNN